MRFLRALALLAALGGADVAWAGEGYFRYILAVTPDGAYQAFAEYTSTGARCGFGPVSRQDDTPVALVAAVCTDAESPGDILPLKQWKWAKSVPEMRYLRSFADKDPWETAEIAPDPDTGVRRLRIRRDKKWITVRVIESDKQGITGVLVTPAAFLLRVQYSANIVDSDEVWSVPQRELDEAPQRWEQARASAREASARMREHRAHGTGVFAPAPSGTVKAKWEQRRRHGIAKFIHDWEIAAAYGALTASETQDALWLLGWFDSPPRRYEALRWYGGLLDRDAGAAKEVLERLAADPDTRALADFLRSTPDPLRNLPLVINDETLRPLSNEQVHWIHRAVRAWLAYRFSEPTVAAYFALRPDYTPYSEKRWRRMLKESRGNPDAILLRAPNPDLRLQSVVREEQRRGIGAPPL